MRPSLTPTLIGTIIDFSQLGGISSGINIKVPQSDRDAGLHWKHFPSKPIKEFFKDWEEKYNSLEWMPIQDRDGGKCGNILSQKQLGMASEYPVVSLLVFIGIYRRNMLTYY